MITLTYNDNVFSIIFNLTLQYFHNFILTFSFRYFRFEITINLITFNELSLFNERFRYLHIDYSTEDYDL